MVELIYIKHLPKDLLLFYLWENAKDSPHFKHCKSLKPTLTKKKARRDVNYMIKNKGQIKVTTYYGRMIFANINSDYINAFAYDLYNGKGSTQFVVDLVIMEEMKKAILTYYKF